MQEPVTVITLSATSPTDDHEDETATIDRAHKRLIEAREAPHRLLDAADARERGLVRQV